MTSKLSILFNMKIEGGYFLKKFHEVKKLRFSFVFTSLAIARPARANLPSNSP